MAIRQVITFRVAPGKAQAFVEGFQPIVEKVRLQPGCEQYAMFTSVDDPDTLVMLERWRDQESLDAALKALYKGRDDPALAFFSHLSGQPVRERYEV